MSLFGTSPPEEAAVVRPRGSIFAENDDVEPVSTKPPADSLFADDLSSDTPPPWNMSPRKKESRVDVIRKLLSDTNVPESYVDVFDNMVREEGINSRVDPGGVARTLAASGLQPAQQARVMAIVAPEGATALGRGEFNVLLALISLAQQGQDISLDAVDQRRQDLPEPHLAGLLPSPHNTPSASTFSIPARAETAVNRPQRPITPPKSQKSPTEPAAVGKYSMDLPTSDPDPWNSPDLHRGHGHAVSSGAHPAPVAAATATTSHIERPIANSAPSSPPPPALLPDSTNGDTSFIRDNLMASNSSLNPPERTTSNFTTSLDFTAPAPSSNTSAPRQSGGGNTGWGGYYDGGFGDGPANPNPFGGPTNTALSRSDRDGGREQGLNPASTAPTRTRPTGAGRPGPAPEENMVVQLMPEKEGMLFFQHHNYEVTSVRRGSKVIRRYSDFVWLLDCLHKRYPFRALPLLPPKRVALNGNHLSNDGAFIEKRRRGLARFLNAVVRHPILREEQLVIMFLTVPTELAVWRKQATISVQEEFQGRELPPGLEESLPSTLEELFGRTRMGVRRSAELYIGVCNIMDRLVKRAEGVAADHARMALSLISLTELSNETYATDANDVPLLNDGLVSMAKHLRTTQGLMEDESKAWDQGVLEDLKRQRDALVSVRDMFDRRERLDRDNIPQLERRISKNESKLQDLRTRPEGVKPGEFEKVEQSIVADKQSIIDQHNRSVFVKECVRDELIYFQTTQYHISRWNQDWAQERVKYSEMLADNWRRLLDELEGMPLGN